MIRHIHIQQSIAIEIAEKHAVGKIVGARIKRGVRGSRDLAESVQPARERLLSKGQ